MTLNPESSDDRDEYEHETCEHGLSAWLCEGPMHYPDDMP